jgi:ABC-type phosphate transport system substrate-binding protein
MNLKSMISGLTAITLCLIIISLANSAEIVIIGNKSISEMRLDKRELKNIFLGRKTIWSDNKKIVFITQEDQAISQRFLKEYINMTPDQMLEYWKEKVFTGQGTPPRSFPSNGEIIQYISQTPGAIGYVSSREGLDNVKIIMIE